MNILLTGASSYVGARLYFDLKRSFDVTGTYHSTRLSRDFVELDITQQKDVIEIARKIKPDVIVHAAGNPNTRWCEANPRDAEAINEKGTKHVVDAANAVDAGVIYISSVAAIDPVNVYGRTKLAGEEHVKNAAWFDILKPSLIIGYSPNTTNDRPFNRLLRNIDDGTPAVYDTSWKFQPTWLGHISEVIKGIIERKIENRIIPITVPELKTRYEVARDILSPFGIHIAPRDDNDKTPVVKVGQDMLKEIGLPTYRYSQIIEKIVDEIKHKERYKLADDSQ